MSEIPFLGLDHKHQIWVIELKAVEKMIAMNKR
jgi:hypothetical protein